VKLKRMVVYRLWRGWLVKSIASMRVATTLIPFCYTLMHEALPSVFWWSSDSKRIVGCSWAFAVFDFSFILKALLRLRFDKIEDMVNEQFRLKSDLLKLDIKWTLSLPRKRCDERCFRWEYDSEVRVLTMGTDYSIELMWVVLNVMRTGDIGLL